MIDYVVSKWDVKGATTSRSTLKVLIAFADEHLKRLRAFHLVPEQFQGDGNNWFHSH